MKNDPNGSPAPTTGPIGSRMVVELLGTPLRQLARLQPTDGPEDTIAQLVVNAARRLDYLNEQLASQAQAAADGLTRVAAGNAQINSLGILQNSATQIDILAARRAASEHPRPYGHDAAVDTHAQFPPES